jgi:uncharacterized protein (DUF488 family)
MPIAATIFTLGHSTRPLDEVEQLLRAHHIGVLVDVRRFPRSRHNPQFNQEQLARSLPELGVRYAWLASLGGRRRSPVSIPTNAGWSNPSFRAFADYMRTHEFNQGLAELVDLAQGAPLTMMCTETVPWRCHRSLIADALTVHGISVVHILNDSHTKPHRLTSFARVQGVQVTYPAPS